MLATAGSVGVLLAQMAKLVGARALATLSTDEKAELGRRAGAGEIIIYIYALASVGSYIGEVFQADRLSAAYSVIERK
jgi:NADPH:quinone reductase-like Zn-dependent oxidoreductase